MSRLDDVATLASAIIARDVPMTMTDAERRAILYPDYQTGPARAAAPGDIHPRLWAWNHPTMAQVIAAEIGTPFERHVEAALIDARAIVFDPDSTESQRRLAAKVIGRWGL